MLTRQNLQMFPLNGAERLIRNSHDRYKNCVCFCYVCYDVSGWLHFSLWLLIEKKRLNYLSRTNMTRHFLLKWNGHPLHHVCKRAKMLPWRNIDKSEKPPKECQNLILFIYLYSLILFISYFKRFLKFPLQVFWLNLDFTQLYGVMETQLVFPENKNLFQFTSFANEKSVIIVRTAATLPVLCEVD